MIKNIYYYMPGRMKGYFPYYMGLINKIGTFSFLYGILMVIRNRNNNKL